VAQTVDHLPGKCKVLSSNLNPSLKKKIERESQPWWCMCVIPALGRLRQECRKFEASPGYVVRTYLQKKKKKRKKKREIFFY
jgi:hypothetical protein